MVRSRAEERREEHKRKRIRTVVIISVAAVLLVIVLIHRWYVSVHAEYWGERKQAVTEAVYAGQLTEVSSAEAFNGEQPWFIVQGQTESGEERIVWVSDEQTIVRHVQDGINEHEAKASVLSRNEGAVIIRMTPGIWRQELCYEVYYRIDHPDGDIYYYDYIRFEDGTWIETLRLGK